MFSIAYKMVGDKDIVNDILQEVFLSYYEKEQANQTIEFPSAWLVRAVINKCIDFSTRQTKHVQLEAIHPEPEIELKEEHPEAAALRRALKKLNSKELKLVLLYSEGYSYKEMAEATNIRFSSIGKLLSRALNKLKEIMRANH